MNWISRYLLVLTACPLALGAAQETPTRVDPAAR